MPDEKVSTNNNVFQLNRSFLEEKVKSIETFVADIETNMTNLRGIFDQKLTNEVAVGSIATTLKNEADSIKRVMEQYNQAITTISKRLAALAASVQESDSGLTKTFTDDGSYKNP